jgi:mRNA interferase MazF
MRKWSIHRANLDPTIGSEQGKTRPVLVISEDAINNLLGCVNVLPITSLKTGRRIYPNEVLINATIGGLNNTSIILCHQIRTIDKLRLSHRYGEVSDVALQQEIMEALCFQLGINQE